MHPGTLETMTFTETCKWMLCLAKSGGLHKSIRMLLCKTLDFARHNTHLQVSVKVIVSNVPGCIRLHHHENAEAIQLLDNTCIVRRLQRKKKTFELV